MAAASLRITVGQIPPGYYVDFSSFPLVLERAVSPIRGDEHLRQVMSIYDAAHARDVPFVAVSDLRAMTSADSRFRKGVAEYYGRNETRSRKNVVAMILVIDSVITRGLVTAVFWWRKPTTRIEVVKTPEQAAEMVERIWAERGIEPTHAMRLGLSRLRSDSVCYQPVAVPPSR